MHVFISWSGERSRLVAELLESWLRCVIQAVRPWLSTKDIERGAVWFSEISQQLQETRLGIVCLTRENKDRPWILFEAGALAKGISTNRVCTLLIDLEPTDIVGPLAQFNHTRPDEAGLRQLVGTLNASSGDQKLPPEVLDKVFQQFWPGFESEFNEILQATPEPAAEAPRKPDEILTEVLATVRALEHRIRRNEVPESILTIESLKSIDRKAIRDQFLKFREYGVPAEQAERSIARQYGNEIHPAILHMIIQQALNEAERSNEKRGG